MTGSLARYGFVVCLLLAALPFAARAEDAAALRATPFFKVCDDADFAEAQCLCFARQLGDGGRGLNLDLLTAMEQDFTLAGKGQITVPAVHAALSHRTPLVSATDNDIAAAIPVLVKATNSCSHAQ
ncbi:MAG TPA: hypothetical protein VNU97_16750 [Rhizomicrobium sp.]|jgi:hypothetical protein|nr:hypothetical protein [Rhizomicrobium sp.]